MSNSHAVLFDLYDTLVEVEIDESSAALWVAVQSYLGSTDSIEKLQEMYRSRCDYWLDNTPRGTSVLKRVFPELIAKHSCKPNLDIEELGDVFRRASRIRLELRDFVRPLLADLRLRGYKTGIVSNTEAILTHVDLEDLDLFEAVDVIVMSSDVGEEKPRARPFKIALKTLDVRADNGVFIGDNYVADIEGAIKAGMRAILLNSRRRRPVFRDGDYLGESPPSLVALREAIEHFENIRAA